LQDITLKEAETIALSMLRQVMEEKVKKNFLELEINVLVHRKLLKTVLLNVDPR